jgi:hypothetical protein
MLSLHDYVLKDTNLNPMDIQFLPISGQVIYRENYEKGCAFEEFITKLFNERSFQVKQWLKSGKRPDRLPWADLTNPDLQMELVFTGARKYRFAEECKWHRFIIMNDFSGKRGSWFLWRLG